jgi:tRNA(fMet)-specific endonuclease VapC
MRVALDSNRYTDSCRGEESVMEVLRTAERIHVPFVVLGELRAGFLRGNQAKKNEQILLRFLATPRVRILLPDEQTTHHYARVQDQLNTQGTPIPTNDIWIAALAIQHNLALCSRDHHFDHLPQIPRA